MRGPPPRPDLRMPLLGSLAWAGALVGFLAPAPVRWALAFAVAGWLVNRRRCGRVTPLMVAAVTVLAVTTASAALVAAATARGPVAVLADDRAVVSLTVRLDSDPVAREGRFGDYVVLRATAREVSGRGRTSRTNVPVLLIGDSGWREVGFGAVVRLTGRLERADSPDLAAVIRSLGDPEPVEDPGSLLAAANHVRAGLRTSVEPLPPAQRSLIPALVVGDDQGMPAEVAQAFVTCGLTHLLAVSGTNLTLVVGFLLVVARWMGVRARGLMVVGGFGVVCYVLLARTEPSVVRAAAMGTVALLGMTAGGRQRGTRALGVAVLVLLLWQPRLALNFGFVLSALATAGILWLAPPWRDALSRWLPRWLAEVVAVPLAAQVVCTPVVAVLSDQVSLVAVAANMVAAPAVGPATVLGLVAGVVALVSTAAGQVLGRLAGWCAGWIVGVAERGASLPGAAVDWTVSAGSITLLTTGCVLLCLAVPSLLARRWPSLVAGVALVVVVAVPLPTPGWPPRDWVLLACDVGQGDAVLLNAGSGAAVLVDAGPDPQLLASCLRRVGVDRLPGVVLSHYHADHVDGLAGVLGRTPVGVVEVSPLRHPPGRADALEEWAASAGVPVRVAQAGEVRAAGDLVWQVLWPSSVLELGGGARAGEGSAANNASVVLLAELRGVRILLTGDIEPEAQRMLSERLPALRADVLKVPHHGSRYQEPEFLTSLDASLAVVSVGEGNDYGHPDATLLDTLREHGLEIGRTDDHGDIAVVLHDGRPVLVPRRS